MKNSITQRVLWTSAALIVMTCATSCFWTQARHIETTRLVPGRLGLPGIKTVAIQAIEGDVDGRLRHTLTQAFLDDGHFEVVERSNLAWAANQGQSMGLPVLEGRAEALISGTIVISEPVEDFDWQPTLEAHGGVATRYERTPRARVAVQWRAINARTGGILGVSHGETDVVGIVDSVTVPNDRADQVDISYVANLFDPVDLRALTTMAYSALSKTLIDDVKPSREPIRVTLFGTANEDTFGEWGQHLRLAEAGDWFGVQDVSERWLTILDQSHAPKKADDDLRVKLMHNWGVALACAGDLVKSHHVLVFAKRRKDLPETRQALAQVEKLIREAPARPWR